MRHVQPALWSCLLLLACGQPGSPSEQPAPIVTLPGEGPAQWVNVFIGTDDAAASVANPVTNGTGGSTFPAASAPFGMVQWGPDTPAAVPPGYRYSDDQIAAFSVNHLNGAGCPSQRDLPITPAIGNLAAAQSATLPLHHESELASPGFYEVRLDSGITVDLTATQRTGFARFTFPPVSDAKLLVRNALDLDVLVAREAQLEVVSPTVIVGSRLDSFCVSGLPTRIYFAARFDRPFVATAFGDAEPTATQVKSLRGGLALGFDARENPAVHMKVGLSSVSTDGALANLAAESPDWDFNAVRVRTLASWNEYLGRAAVAGGSDSQRQLFYSALYRVFLQPAVWSDVSGAYFGFDQQPHAGDGHTHYANFSGWDIYRSWIQLAALLAPAETSDMVRSLILDGQQGGALPQWAYGTSETAVMIGDPSDAIIANAWAFGAQDFDGAAALALMKHGASDPSATCNDLRTRPGLADYLSRHFCPHDGAEKIHGPTAATLEYAVADAAIGRFAASQGDAATAAEYAARAEYWTNVFDPTATAGAFSGYVQPRLGADAMGAPAFVHADVGSSSSVVEGSLAQYSFLVPQDVPGLIAAMGGDAAFIGRLDDHLAEVNSGTHGTRFYIGNEPGFATPWQYPFAGAPAKTQEAVRRILNSAFSTAPGGLPGNEDLGALSSWIVWAMLGLYPEVPGVGGLIVGSPAFPQVALRMAGGGSFRITAQGGEAPQALYVQDASLNGAALPVPWLPFEKMRGGGELKLSLGTSSSPSWGTAPKDRPQAVIPSP